jgi:ribose transport system substrate-binding protein
MYQHMKTRHRVGRPAIAATCVIGTLLLTAACGSGSSGGGTPAAASGGSSAGATNSSLTAAQAVVKKYEATPQSIPQQTPLKHAATKGKTFVDLVCENTQCHDIAIGVQAAGKAIGWNIKLISYNDAQPATLASAFNQALRYHPVGVSLTGTSPALWSSVLPAYKKAGVPIFPASVGPVAVQDPIGGTIDSLGAYTVPAQAIADWFITASGGSGHVLLVDIPSFPVLKETADAVTKSINSGCSKCKITDFNATIPQVDSNGVVPAVVSQLRRDPSIKYVISSDGVFISGLASAAKAAGVTNLKIGSTIGGITNEQDILTGTESATLPWPGVIEGWVIIDAAARHSEGMPVPDGDSNQPLQLLVKGNFTTPQESLLQPADYPNQFKKLWQVGS